MNSALLLLFLLFVMMNPSVNVRANEAPRPSLKVFDFTVYLDDAPVGQHTFKIDGPSDARRVQSEAAFNVKVLMINAYHYQHRAEENWKDNCLASLKASTNDNGSASALEGKATAQAFLLSQHQEHSRLPACIMTFAYWNPDMLKQSQLLNPQTGDYLDVQISPKGSEVLSVRGQNMTTNRYHLKTRQFDMDLWYAGTGDWVGLDSRLENGHTLRYRLGGTATP